MFIHIDTNFKELQAKEDYKMTEQEHYKSMFNNL